MFGDLFPYILSMALASAGFVVYALYAFVLYRVRTTLTIGPEDSKTWLYLHSYVHARLKIATRNWSMDGTTKLRASTMPFPSFVWFEGKRLWLQISESPGDAQKGIHRSRSAFLWAFLVDDAFLERFLAMIKMEYLKNGRENVPFSLPHVNGTSAFWYSQTSISRRDFATLTLDDDLQETILHDLSSFVKPSTRAFYRQHGIPYRRGWLLHGPPGNGKTSLILAAASFLGSEIRRLSLTGNQVNDMTLANLMNGPAADDPPSLLVLEDIDCLFGDRATSAVEEDDASSTSSSIGSSASTCSVKKPAVTTGVTFSGLLNALDGVGSPENVIMIMTTNYPERLDAALVRPGRVDLRLCLQTPDDSRIARHYLKFFPKFSRFSEETVAFVKRCRDEHGSACSMAQVQGVVLQEVAERYLSCSK